MYLVTFQFAFTSFFQQRGGGDALSPDQNKPHLRWCSSEFHKLLKKIQGIPPLADYLQLELTVVYNVCLCSTAQSQFSEAELLLTQATERVLQMTGDAPVASDPPVFWRTVINSVGDTALNPCVLYLLCLQWAIWLSTCQLKIIQECQLFSVFETLSTGVWDEGRSELREKSSDIPLLVMDPRRLIELLQICTIIAQGHLLSPSLLLRSQSLSSLLSVPSALSVLHNLALKCVHAEGPPLPSLPELYLQAGAALLMARWPADCMALCDEVITTTLELLPEKVVLAEPEEKCEAETRALCAEGDDRVAMLLWAGAAYLLQGHCHTQLKDWKQAVTHYTRCFNLLVKARFKKGKKSHFLHTLQLLLHFILGISFTQTDQLREALRDLQLSMQAFPECVSAGLWCGEVLWRLGRRWEAAACWEKTWSFTPQFSSNVANHKPSFVLFENELKHFINSII
uniref:FA complementation group G n=1 Tax=Sander lucioperca TaxID=283035 RepID=A0A8D0AM29_SANLU